MAGCSVAEVLQQSVSWLKSRGISEPESSVTQLLSEALGLPWSNGFVQLRNIHQGMPDELAARTLTESEWHSFLSMMERRVKHEPIQYVLGKWDFLDFTLHIQSPLLCPRPETEELVGHVLADSERLFKEKKKNSNSEPSLRILDVGCGTGAIGIALAKSLGPAMVTKVVGIDVEPVAVETARRNAIEILPSGYRRVYEAMLSSANDFEDDDGGFDIVVSNPPYIPRPDMKSLSEDVVGFESDTALCGGDDGMDVIRDIVHSLKKWCPNGGTCWMEVDPTQPSLLRPWLVQEGREFGVEFVDSFRDLYGRERFINLAVPR